MRTLDPSVLATVWKRVRLGTVCSFRHGGTPTKSRPEFWQGKIPWISPKDMGSDNIADAPDRISEDAVRNSSTSLVPPGTVLVVVRSGILARRLPVAVTETEVAFNQDIKAILPDPEKLDPQYLRFALKLLEKSILEEGVKVGATVHSVRSGYIENLEIPLSSLAEQKRIARMLKTRLATIERARQAAEEQLSALQRLPAALFRQAFSGDL